MATTYHPSVPRREVTDRNGRVYRIGESDVDLMSRTRTWMAVLPWVGTTGISAAAFTFAAAADPLHTAHPWSGQNIFKLLGVWVCFQAAVAFPAGRLRESGRLPARTAMTMGALGTLLGGAFLAFAPNASAVRLGFAVCGGIGTGLVHATCVNTTGKWFPERRGATTGLVGGGPALGALPFVVLLAAGLDLSEERAVLTGVGVGLCLAVAAAGRLLQDPPKNWWPAHIDPLRQAADPKIRRALRKNPPAVRHYTPKEAARTPVLWMMSVCLLCTTGIGVLGIAVLVPFGEETGFADATVTTAIVLTALVAGAAGGVVGRFSDRYGRRNTLSIVCIGLGTAQFGVLISGRAGSMPFYLLCAVVVGLCSGAVLPLFAAMTADYFGENDNAATYGLIHSSTAIAGVVGLVTGALVTGSPDYDGAFVPAGSLGLATAVLALFLKAPGRPNARRIVPNPHPLGEEMSLT
jgi:MFS family permease